MELSAGVVGVCLILVGAALLVLEMNIPGFGGSGAVGIVAVAAGALIVLDSSGFLKLPRAAIIALCILGAIFIPFATVATIRAKRAPVKLPADIVGSDGYALTELDPFGAVRVRSEEWSAESESGRIEAGTRVRVTGENGLKLRVSRFEDT